MGYDDERTRFRAYGNQLIGAHLRLREMVDDLYDALDEGRDLRLHCLTLCTAVTRHHTAEDATVFPLLAERHPELADFLGDLRRDHEIIGGMVHRLESATTHEELDGLSAVLETHFIGEEKRLTGVLNALEPLGDLGIEVVDGRS
ncbi:hemerythrin domain-containing protein [Paractinoplanes hotanensis]|uniref:Hemerythrin domain-containing protein n=1 Tax=Paractinoplanes hotanensis TaxID=2906497 RepID=A0ABT0XZD6_9ACTN|nr:hemerythrin domain-containing protein [Actinoplanes hotanensis]MCM4079092.1 hemerythrin domain-containing protein [Actinoplanes hotanensis]